MVLKAKIFDHEIGVLSEKDGGYFFQYFDSFVSSQLEISPLSLPLSNRVYSGREFMAFEMIPSVFYDSLPDSFGSSLMALYFKEVEGSFDAMKNPLRKLSFMGNRAIGAIEYEPVEIDSKEDMVSLELKRYIENSRKVLSADAKEVIKSITSHPSPGGARPKAFVGWNKKTNKIKVGVEDREYQPWIVKFYEDDITKKYHTKVEYIYFEIARDLGLDVPEFDFVAYDDEFHFAVKRFDRVDGKKIHLHTLSSLINRRFDQRGLISYEDLLKTTMYLTNSIDEVKEAYKRMVFNIVGNNCDDHAKNFSFMMDEDGRWSLAPAYDLVYSFGEGVYKEHFLSVCGKRVGFKASELVDVAVKNGISEAEAKVIIENTNEIFSGFENYAKKIDIDTNNVDFKHNLLK